MSDRWQERAREWLWRNMDWRPEEGCYPADEALAAFAAAIERETLELHSEAFEALVAQAVAVERERCARVCEVLELAYDSMPLSRQDDIPPGAAASNCAAAIRRAK